MVEQGKRSCQLILQAPCLTPQSTASALEAICAILHEAQHLLEAEAGGSLKIVTFIRCKEGVNAVNVLP
jgi:hypothetical protein